MGKVIAHTVFIVHLLDFEEIFPLVDNIIVEFIQTRRGGNLGAWKFCYWGEKETVNYEAKIVDNAQSNDTDANTQSNVIGQISLHDEDVRLGWTNLKSKTVTFPLKRDLGWRTDQTLVNSRDANGRLLNILEIAISLVHSSDIHPHPVWISIRV